LKDISDIYIYGYAYMNKYGVRFVAVAAFPGASGTEEFVHTIFATVEAIIQHPVLVVDHCAIVVDHILPSLAVLTFSLVG